MPVRVSLRPTFLTSSRAAGWAAAAAIQKAALEMSPGTLKLRDSGICPPASDSRFGSASETACASDCWRLTRK